MKPHPARRPAKLRRAAEARRKAKPATPLPETKVNLRRLLHELEVHQIELEMQNDELGLAEGEITAGLERYVDLFDFAPVGYFNLTANGTIRLVNLTGARQLNHDRAGLLRRRFGTFVAEPDRRAFGDCLGRLFASGNKQTCELTLTPTDQPPLFGYLEITRAPDRQECRVVLIDISERKRSEASLEVVRQLRAESEKMGKVGSWELQVDTQTQIWTEEVFQIHEVPPTFEPTLANSLAFYAPASRPKIAAALQRASQNGEPFDLELELITAKANLRFVRVTGQADGPRRRVHGSIQNLTDQKLAVDALRQSEDRYRLLVEGAPDGIGIYQDGKLVFVNAAGVRQAGAQHQDEILGRGLEQIVHPDDQAAAVDRLRRRLAGDTRVYPSEVRYVRLDGGVVPMEVGASPILYHGRPAVQFMVRDISERKQAEAVMRESETRHRTIIETSPDGFWVVSRQAQLLEVNAAYCRMSGYSETELLGLKVSDLEAVETPAETAAHMERVVTLGHDRFESQHRRQDGSIFPVEISVQYLPTKGGWCIVFLRDITERKQAEAALRASETRLRAIFGQAAVGIAQVAPDGRWLAVNERLCAILGYSRDELLAGNFQSLTDPEDLETDLEFVRQLLAGRISNYAMEKRYRRQDGQVIWAQLTVSLVREASGTPDYFISVVEDISARKRMEAELRQSENFNRCVMDALTNHIAVMDEHGTILAVNEAWRQFTRENGGDAASYYVGANYLTVCRGATHQVENALGETILQGLLTVLRGERAQFAFEYPCDSVDELRWFNLRATRFPVAGPVRVVVAHENISERKRAEAALGESEARLRLSVHAANVGLWDWQLGTDHVYFSPEWKNQLGYAEAEIPNRYQEWIRRLHPADVKPAARKFKAFIANPQGRYQSEYRLRHKDGSYRWIHSLGDVSRDAAGQVVRMLGCHIDITNSKVAEAALRESERFSMDVLNSLTAHIAVMDEQGTIVAVNAAWQRFARQYGGGDPTDYVGSNYLATSQEFLQRSPDELLDVTFRGLLTVMRGEQSEFALEYPRKFSDGKRWFQLRATRFPGAGPVRVVVAHEDITERKQAEENQRASELRYRALFENMMDACAYCELVFEHGQPRDFIYLAVNTAFKVLTGRTEVEVEGKRVTDVYPTLRETNPELFEMYGRVARSGRAERLESFVPPLNAWLAIGAYSPQPGFFVATLRDITGRKRSAQALYESEHRFFQLAENINEVFWLRDAVTNDLLYVSPGYEPLWRQTCASLYAARPAWLETIHPEDRDRIARTMAQATTTAQDQEFRIVWPDRTIRWIRDRSFPIRNDAGAVYRIAGVAEDVTAQHDLAAMVAERLKVEAQLSKLVATVPGTVYSFRLKPNGSTSLPYTSPRFAEMFALDPAIVVRDAETIFSRMHPEDKAKLQTSIEVSAQGLAPWNCIFRVGDPEVGYHWIEGRSLPEREADGSILWHGFLLDITERITAEARLKTLTEQLRLLAANLNTTREEERGSLAREMHDVVAQEMIRLKMDLSQMHRHVARTGTEIARLPLLEQLAAAIQLTDKSLSSVQHIATGLRPVVLDSLGLSASIQWQADEFTKRTKIPCQVTVPATDQLLDHVVATALFRILQEALTNVERHANATRVEIRLQSQDGQVLLAVQDNGRGMQEHNFTDPTSIGILGMHERALMLGAQLEITSQPGRGTTVQVRLQLNPESP